MCPILELRRKFKTEFPNQKIFNHKKEFTSDYIAWLDARELNRKQNDKPLQHTHHIIKN